MLIREEIVTQVGWYREEWATPYMAAVARVVFKPTIGLVPLSHPRLGLPKPEVTLTPQPGSGVLPRYMPLPLDSPDVTLTPQPAPQRISPFWGIIGKIFGKPDVTLTPQPVTELGAKPELGEWFKENRILVVVVIVALVVLFFFLKKRRR